MRCEVGIQVDFVAFFGVLCKTAESFFELCRQVVFTGKFTDFVEFAERIVIYQDFHRCPADLYWHLARLLIFGGPMMELSRIRANEKKKAEAKAKAETEKKEVVAVAPIAIGGWQLI